MAIIAYVGLPGSGKTYDVVANQVLPALDQGRRVVTNIPLNKDAIRARHPRGEIVDMPVDLIAQQPELIEDYWTPGSVVIFDEVWRLWPAGLKADRIPQQFKSILAEHRHRVDSQGRAMQIVFVTQDLSQIAAFARQLVEQTFHHTKLSHVGKRNSYRIDVFHGAVTGAVPPVQNRLREIYGSYKPQVWRMYKSHTMSEARSGGADERTVDARGNILKRPVILLGLLFVVVAVWFGVTTVSGILSGEAGFGASVASPEAGSRVEALSPVQAPTYRPPPAQASPSKLAAVPAFRLAGYVEVPGNPDESRAMVTDGQRVTVIPWNRCRTGQDGDVQCKYQGLWVGPFGVIQ
jgi:zona occludens toxin